jgi:hypothetical protein
MSIEEKIINQIQRTGFRLMKEQDGPFTNILWRKILLTDNIFALTHYKEGQNIDDIIINGRLWSNANLNGFMEKVLGSGLNLVIFHKGELSVADIEGKCDNVANLSVLLLSITIVNIIDNKIEQARTWILLPTLVRTLSNINKA